MKNYTIEQLGVDSENWREKNKTKINMKYQLCKRLGFSTYETMVLKGKSLKTIAALAIERGYIKDASELESL